MNSTMMSVAALVMVNLQRALAVLIEDCTKDDVSEVVVRLLCSSFHHDPFEDPIFVFIEL